MKRFARDGVPVLVNTALTPESLRVATSEVLRLPSENCAVALGEVEFATYDEPIVMRPLNPRVVYGRDYDLAVSDGEFSDIEDW